MKNISELIGLVNGIVFDGIINQKETEKLKIWVEKNRNLAYEAKEIELISLMETILEDNVITDQEREVLIEYCGKYNSKTNPDSEIYLLQGILEGIVSDGVINNLEVIRLQEWMENYGELLRQYPKCQSMVEKINAIIEDGVITEEEKQVLVEIINDQMDEVQLEAKIAFLCFLVREHKNIGIDLIDLIGDEKALSRIHELAEDELDKGLSSHYGTVKFNRELVFISLAIIAMLHYEEGRFYESVRDTYKGLYYDYSAQKVEGFIRSFLARYRKDESERQVNVVLRNTVVPGYYLPAFFDFIFDIYKLNFQYDLPEDMYEDFKFVYEGLRQVMMSDGDDVQINVTRKTYKLIRTTKQLIADEELVDSVIKLSIIIARLIDKKIWNKELKVYNPYLKQGFDTWAEKLIISSRDLEGRKERSNFRSRWEPKYELRDNNVFIVPPVHRIKASYDYRTVKIEIENDGDILYSNDHPDIRDIMGGYEISIDRIRIYKPLGKIIYRLFAGNEVIYDSKESLYRNLLVFSYKDNSEVKNNTDFTGNAIFCYRGECERLSPYHKTVNYFLAQYGAHLGDSVLVENEIFNFSSLVRPGVFGDEIPEHFLYEAERNQRYSIFRKAKYLVFETTNIGASIEVDIDGKPYKTKDLNCKTVKREGVVKYLIDIPDLNSGFHCISIYELLQGRRTAIATFEFAVDPELIVEVVDTGDKGHFVSVASELLDDVVTLTLEPDTYSLEWLKFENGRRTFSLQVPLPFTYYSLDGEKWHSTSDYLWIGDITADTSIYISNKRITEMVVYDAEGRRIEEPVKFLEKTLYNEVKIGFLKSFTERNDYCLMALTNNLTKVDTLICYNRCVLSDETRLEYDSTDKLLDLDLYFFGKGKVYFIIENRFGEQLYKSSFVENGEMIGIDGLKSFEPYTVTFFEKKAGLSLTGDRQFGKIVKEFYNWSDLVGKTFKISEVYFDQNVQNRLLHKTHFFNRTFLCITKELDGGAFEGQLYTNTSKGKFFLYNINPVMVEICGEAVNGRVELSITKDGDGLLLDFEHHNIKNTLDDLDAVDIFSYVMELKGIEFV